MPVSGTETYVAGEYAYTDHLYDDYGADVAPARDAVAYRFTLNTLLQPDPRSRCSRSTPTGRPRPGRRRCHVTRAAVPRPCPAPTPRRSGWSPTARTGSRASASPPRPGQRQRYVAAATVDGARAGLDSSVPIVLHVTSDTAALITIAGTTVQVEVGENTYTVR